MRQMIGIFALLVGAVGWYYLFYSHATQHLERIEDQRTNRLRGTLRRVNAFVMLLMALGMAMGTFRFRDDTQPIEYFITWSAVILLLLLAVVLAMVDLRMTQKLSRSLRRQDPK